MGGEQRTISGKEVCTYVYFLVDLVDSLGVVVLDVLSFLRFPAINHRLLTLGLDARCQSEAEGEAGAFASLFLPVRKRL